MRGKSWYQLLFVSAPDSTVAEVLVPYLLKEAGTVHLQDDGLSLLFLRGLRLPPTGVLMELVSTC